MKYALGGTGIWSGGLRYGDQADTARAAADLEGLGYTAIWLPDVGGNLFDVVANLLRATSTITVATGILNLWMHDAAETAERHHAFVEEFGPRVLFGIGVSHAPLINLTEAGRYQRPLHATSAYLDAIDATPHPVPRPARLLAALGPKMLELAAARAGGAHPYLVTPQHTAIVREALGPDALVAPEQAVVLEADPVEARRLARVHLAMYLPLPNYFNNWLRLGFSNSDLLGGGSDRLVDALVAWGDEQAILNRVKQHRVAGADHVCVQVLTDDPVGLPLDTWRQLAPVLTA